MGLKENQKVKRGEIYLHDFGSNEGSIQNGVRPVLVVQCDEGNQASTTTVVAALTSVIKKRGLSRTVWKSSTRFCTLFLLRRFVTDISGSILPMA